MKYIVIEPFGKLNYGFIFNIGDIISSVSDKIIHDFKLDPEKSKDLFVYMEKGHGSSCVIRTIHLSKSDKVEKYEN